MPAQRISKQNQDEFAYILVTPAKNEEASLPGLVQSILKQNLRPIAWFIVDDGSEDGTSRIIDKACSRHSWIHSLKLNRKRTYDIGEHYASVCINGFDYALDYCKRNNLAFGYIALSDADMVYPEDYFARCIDFLHDNKQFGIVSGRVLSKDREGNIRDEKWMQLGDGTPHGTGRVWKREVFVDTGGYMVTKSPDTVSTVKALLKGFKVRQIPDIVCYQTRLTAGKHSLWSGYFNKGERAYYINANPLSIFNAIIGMLFISRQKNRIVKGLALFSGYCKSFIRREPQLEDDEVKRYIGSYKRVVSNYWLFLKGFRKGKS
jgi:glycosyltransferase involved in cell wall biosynthesis